MRKPLLILLPSLALVLAALVFLELRRREAETWSTDSPAALAAFERGLQAHMRLYGEEAKAELEAALAADPGFLAPRFFLFDLSGSHGGGEEHAAAIRAADLSALRPRERFLATFFRAVADRDDERAGRVVEEFLAARPRDPWALHLAAFRAWNRAEWERAEELYERLVKVDPNWVLAHNHLGYIAMGQGRFADSEARFRTYAFVAPDQANPHDSLGELLFLLGRYDEARAELERAVELRPDFCASYRNLLRATLFADRVDEVEGILTRAGSQCPGEMVEGMACHAATWEALRTGRAKPFWDDLESRCPRKVSPLDLLRFRLALLGGGAEAARSQLAQAEARVAEIPGELAFGAKGMPRALVLHMRGLLALAAGAADEACELLREADERLLYFGSVGGGTIKLFNRAVLAMALDRAGRGGEAEALRAEIAAVNPDLARFDDTQLVDLPPP